MIEPQKTMYDTVYDYVVESIKFPKLMLSDKSYKHLLLSIYSFKLLLIGCGKFLQ